MNKSESSYGSTVQFLYSLQKHGIKLGLANTEALMKLLKWPHRAFRAIHIAGTNGKGFTATDLAAMLAANDLKVGLFTSPHLVSFTERIRINNRKIDESDVIQLASKIRSLLEGTELNPTFFEFVTAMAFHYFAVNSVDWAVIETGMGGRLDATNVLSPEVCIITNISHDHMEFLGDSLTDITYEKAGIIKPGVPVVTAASQPDVLAQLQEISRDRNTVLHVYGRDFKARLRKTETDSTHFDYSGYNRFSDLSVPLAGAYQAVNASMAVRAYELLQKKKVPLSDKAIRKGLKAVNLEGRLEWVSDDPPILIDSAHNAEASRALASNIRQLLPDRNIISILGIMDDKDLQEIMGPLVEISRIVILTKAKYDRAASPDRLREIIETIQRGSAHLFEAIITGSVPEAMDLARKVLRKKDIILVAGSFYTSGEVKELLGSVGVLSTLENPWELRRVDMRSTRRDTPHIVSPAGSLKFLVVLFLFLLAPPALFSAEESITISADYLEYISKTDTYIARGSAVIIYQDTRLQADEMEIANKTSDATATGNVIYEDAEVILKGRKIELNLKTKLGTIYDSYLFYKNRNIHLRGGDIQKTGKRSFSLDRARVTSCDADVPSWHIEGKEVQATQNKSLSAWHTTFNIRDIPVLYSPYAWYPLSRERQTGFLFPEFGYSSTRGYYYKQGFFWALKENQDAAFHLDYYDEKGLAQGLNYRYIINPESKGELWVYHVRDDKPKRDLTEVKSYIDQKLPYDMKGYLKVHAVSEFDYYDEMDSTSQGQIGVQSWGKTNPFGFASEERLQKYLESNLHVEKSFRGSRAYLLGQYRQSLEGSSSLVPQNLPEAGYVLYTQSKGPFAFNLFVKGNNIWRSEGQKALRLDINPNLYFSYGRVLNVTQKIGLRETVYHLNRPGGNRDRTIIDLTTALSTTLFKGYESFVHIIEPSLEYTYIPNVDQSNIPFFDSLDSIPHTSSIRYALTNRLSGLNPTYLEARFRLSQSYSLLNVEKNFSPLLAEATLESKYLDFNLNASYDVHDNEISETIASARLKNSTGYIGIGKNFRSATNLDQLTLEGALYSPIRLRGKAIPIGINGKIWYDLNGNGVQEATVSTTYSHQCWGLTLTYNRNSEDYQIIFAIELKGLTTFGLGSADSLLSNTSY